MRIAKLLKKVLALAVLGGILGGAWLVQHVRSGIQPMPSGTEPKYVRYDASMPLTHALLDLQARKVVRDADALRWYALYRRKSGPITAGTYALHPGMSADEILDSLHLPIRQMVRIPETNWSNRTSRLLEQKEVVQSADYQLLVKQPQLFQKEVGFPLPKTTLEGYLWPDTYDLPPMLGARAVIEKQLKAFEKKVWIPLGKPENLNKALIVASLVELEVARDEERPIVAGVIYNRLKKGMPLQIDSTILYAQDRWHEPSRRDIRNTESPYNTYKHKGLPPTPVCSPSFKSILAALHPEKTKYLYYVALPDGHSLFAGDPAGHQKNIALRKAALALLHVGGTH